MGSDQMSKREADRHQERSGDRRGKNAPVKAMRSGLSASMTRRRNRVVLRSEQRAPPTSGATSRHRVAAPLPKCMSATWRILKAPSWRKRRGKGGVLLKRGAAAVGSGLRWVERRMRSKERRQGRRRETREVEDEEPIDLAGRRLPPPTASHRTTKQLPYCC
jgi:hypothetical protein